MKIKIYNSKQFFLSLTILSLLFIELVSFPKNSVLTSYLPTTLLSICLVLPQIKDKFWLVTYILKVFFVCFMSWLFYLPSFNLILFALVLIASLKLCDKNFEYAYIATLLSSIILVTLFQSVEIMVSLSLIGIVLFGYYSFVVLVSQNKEERIATELKEFNINSLSTMASGIAHEVNNPLMIVKGSASIIRKKIQSDNFEKENILKHSETIEDTVERISHIITSLKNLSRDGIHDDKEPFLFRELWNDVEGLLVNQMKSSEVTLKMEKDDALFEEIVFGQRIQLSQVFINLVKNSFDAIEDLKEKWVAIELSKIEVKKQDLLVIDVIDSGKGLSKDQAKDIFDPFFTTKEIGKGTGLGLSLCQTIIENNEGSIEVIHDKPHTCFRVTIPLFRHSYS